MPLYTVVAEDGGAVLIRLGRGLVNLEDLGVGRERRESKDNGVETTTVCNHFVIKAQIQLLSGAQCSNAVSVRLIEYGRGRCRQIAQNG